MFYFLCTSVLPASCASGVQQRVLGLLELESWWCWSGPLLEQQVFMAAELSFLPCILSFTKNVSSDLSAISDVLAFRHALFGYLLHFHLFFWCLKSRVTVLEIYFIYSLTSVIVPLDFVACTFTNLVFGLYHRMNHELFNNTNPLSLSSKCLNCFFRFSAWQACMTVLWFSFSEFYQPFVTGHLRLTS